MVSRRMKSQRSGNGETLAQIQSLGLKSKPLGRQGSLYSLTIDELQTQLLDLRKPISSMTLDELLTTVRKAEASNQSRDFDRDPAVPSGSSLNLSKDLSEKTVDEVWRDIQTELKRCPFERNTTLGTMTLDDILAMAGSVGKSPLEKEDSGPVLSVGAPHEAQWMNFQLPSVQQQQSTVPVFIQGRSVDVAANLVMETQALPMPPYSLIGTLSDSQMPGHKRVAHDEIVEETVERRQKRMMKNRESAARSRARKQAYTHELENKISLLEEENDRLRRRKEWEVVVPSIPVPRREYQHCRAGSAPI